MAFLASGLLKQVLANNTTTLAQVISLDKKTAALAARFIRDNTKECAKPLLILGVAGAVAYGASRIRTEILKQRAAQLIDPTPREIRNLLHTAQLVDGNCGPDPRASDSSFGQDIIEEFLRRTHPGEDDIIENFCIELQEYDQVEEILDFGEYLELDPTVSKERTWIDDKGQVEIAELSEGFEAAQESIIADFLGGDNADELEFDKLCALNSDIPDGLEKDKKVSQGLLTKVISIKQHVVNFTQFKKQRKRVRSGQLSKATKGLAMKIRASFPIPDGSQLQQKAMCLYAAKECRKELLRESQIAVLIPQAVALASVPSDEQINMRMLTNIEPVQLRYNKMAWSGYKNKDSWLAKMSNIFA